MHPCLLSYVVNFDKSDAALKQVHYLCCFGGVVSGGGSGSVVSGVSSRVSGCGGVSSAGGSGIVRDGGGVGVRYYSRPPTLTLHLVLTQPRRR